MGGRVAAGAEDDTGIEWFFGTTAYGLFRETGVGGGVIVAAARAGGTLRVHARRVLLATGAYDLPVPIPGGTLPGVFMAGAVQGFLKSQKLRVADRLVLAGSHPLLFIVADQLRAAGADVVELAFARGLPSLREAFRSLAAIPGHTRLLAELAACVVRLQASGTRIRTRTLVTAAEGERGVERVRLSSVDRFWRPRGAERTVDVDALVLGFGFHPSTELARQFGCALRWDSPKGGWVVATDERLATTVPGVFAAGEPTGVAGAEQSRTEGVLAGLAIADDLEATVSARDREDAQRARAHSDRFARVVQELFEPDREGLLALTDAGTTVCRCERVTRGAIDGFLDANPFAGSASAVKLECRSGMGPCQGRYCETTVAGLVARSRGMRVEDAGRFAAHVPVKPVPLTSYLGLAEET
ncbi:FAD/NAD(P)-dependent oxidoreductase [Leifsonia poae]|uniref:FAD/NAD(P)-dependent oxidoreductase n=1 Tax=Leifsonia poae TaxID=110933 RepID=UPI001CBE0682|nr:NAD(P)/FAD-dependent oxidoreductase [Leifsonia poae]